MKLEYRIAARYLTSPRSSKRPSFITFIAAGGVPRRERVGHSNMKKAMVEGRAIFGGELSGHFYFRDNYSCDSGAIVFATAISVISASKQPLSAMIAPLAAV